jgi:hypothetical protein
MNKSITVLNLFNFIPLNNKEKEIFDFDNNIINEFKTDLDKGMFYLGGFLKMSNDDYINIDSIKQVREMSKIREIEYGGPCNSFEANSIINHERKLRIIENMLLKYNIIMELREKN